MNMEKSCLKINNYGVIRLKLKEYMDKIGMKRGTLARITGTRFEVIDRWYQNCVQQIDMDVLARICYVLNCDIEDMIEYVPNQKEKP